MLRGSIYGLVAIVLGTALASALGLGSTSADYPRVSANVRFFLPLSLLVGLVASLVLVLMGWIGEMRLLWKLGAAPYGVLAISLTLVMFSEILALVSATVLSLGVAAAAVGCLRRLRAARVWRDAEQQGAETEVS